MAVASTPILATEADPRAVSRRTLALVAAAGLAMAAINLYLVQRNFFEIENPDHGSHYLGIPNNLLWIFVGLYAWARRPANPIGKWMIAVGFAGFTYVGGLYPDPVTWLISSLLVPLPLVLTAYVFLAFPSGHLRDHIDRVLMGIVVADATMSSLINLVTNGHPLNPVYLVSDEAVQRSLWTFNDAMSTLLLPIVAARVLLHWRNAPPAGRRVLTPVIIGTAPYLVVLFASRLDLLLGPNQLTDMSHGYPAVILPGYALPIAFLVGLLRTQLARSVVGDVVRELDAGVEPGALEGVLVRALGDPTLRLAYERPDGSYVDGEGLLIALPSVADPDHVVAPLGRGGAWSEVLVHDRALEADPELVASIAAAARLALENERLHAEVRAQLEEVRASRARIVAAGLDARRQVERDLHDGAQQQLLALSVRLQMARGEATGDPRLEAMLTAAGSELDTAIADLRGLARGIHPTVLTELGLGAAVENLADRCPIPVEVSIADGRCSEVCEATAYFVVSEALANIARHAAATRVRVAVARHGDELEVAVSDDGRGGASLSGSGSGLRGLADRVAAAGGTLIVDSPGGRGTRVSARIPCG
jgi:signal transduction histidine kinase